MGLPISRHRICLALSQPQSLNRAVSNGRGQVGHFQLARILFLFYFILFYFILFYFIYLFIYLFFFFITCSFMIFWGGGGGVGAVKPYAPFCFSDFLH